jgi:hypothetical protein
MKFMSYTCSLWELNIKKKWLTDDIGVTIFKVIELDEHIPGLGIQTVSAMIVFYIPDKEFETMLKLTYPPGTFEEHMA